MSRTPAAFARVWSGVWIAMVGAGLALSGCASQQAPGPQAAAIGPTAKPAAAPARSHVDDPREPWSPHYGTRPRLHDWAPAPIPAPVEAGSTRIATMDADAVIRHAVAQHEMRRP